MKSTGKAKAGHDDLDGHSSAWQSIYINSPIGIEIYDADGILIDANPACLRIFGVESSEEVKGLNLFEDPNLPDEAKQQLRQGESIHHEVPFDFDLVRKQNLYQTTRSGIRFLKYSMAPCEIRAQRIRDLLFMFKTSRNANLQQRR